MVTSVRFCLSYAPLKHDFITFKMNFISIRKCIVDTDVVIDMYAQKVIIITFCTCMSLLNYTCGHAIFMTQRYPLKNSDDIRELLNE